MNSYEETLTERLVTYSIELDGKFYIVENVPARVNEETGGTVFCSRYRGKSSNKNSR